MSKLVEQVQQRFATRQAEAAATRAAAEAEQAKQRAAYRGVVLALTRGRKAALGAEDLDGLLVALGKLPADLERDVSALRALIAQAEQADPVGAQLGAIRAAVELAAAQDERARLEREADHRSAAARHAYQHAAGQARAAHERTLPALDATPAAALERYYRARRALDLAEQALQARLTRGPRLTAEEARTPVATLLAACEVAGAEASAAWAGVLEQVGGAL